MFGLFGPSKQKKSIAVESKFISSTLIGCLDPLSLNPKS